MRVFLTGASGFVGSHVARILRAHGHDVHALVLPGEDAACAGDVAVVRGDLVNPESYRVALANIAPEACIHAGWYANPKDYLGSRLNVGLLAASTSLVSMLVDLGCRRLVGVGTCFEYDVSYGWLSEGSALAPRHLYSTCKRALFDVASSLCVGTSTRFAWARLFFLYGPRESQGRLVPAVMGALLRGEEARVTMGEQIRDFLHVADAAAGLVHVMESSLAGPVNVASGRPVAVREVVATIARLVEASGRPSRVAYGAVPARAGDPPFVCASVERLAGAGFRPAFDLETGLANTIEWARASETMA